MRGAGRTRMGYFPLPLSEAQRIRRFLFFPEQPSSALDPCVGDGAPFEAITGAAQVIRYGIELDAYRAQQARERITRSPGRYVAGALPGRKLRPAVRKLPL